MKMKNRIFSPIIIFILLGTTWFVSSCNEEEFLDCYPKDIPNPENFFIDEFSARKAVNAAYEPWANSSRMYTRDLVIVFDAMTEDSYWRPSRNSSIQQEAWDIYPSHGDIAYYWEYPAYCWQWDLKVLHFHHPSDFSTYAFFCSAWREDQ